jgi:hypothetical protein
MGDWPRPPPSSPHSTTVTPLSLTLRGTTRLVGCRGSLISPSCCPLGSLLDHALLSAAQQSSPHSLPLPTPPPPAAPSLSLSLVSPSLTSCTPSGQRHPHLYHFPLRPRQQWPRLAPFPSPRPPLRRPPHERRQRTAQWSRGARGGRKAVRACVSSVAGPRSRRRGEMRARDE